MTLFWPVGIGPFSIGAAVVLLLFVTFRYLFTPRGKQGRAIRDFYCDAYVLGSGNGEDAAVVRIWKESCAILVTAVIACVAIAFFVAAQDASANSDDSSSPYWIFGGFFIGVFTIIWFFFGAVKEHRVYSAVERAMEDNGYQYFLNTVGHPLIRDYRGFACKHTDWSEEQIMRLPETVMPTVPEEFKPYVRKLY
jgi:hypothetical protein